MPNSVDLTQTMTEKCLSLDSISDSKSYKHHPLLFITCSKDFLFSLPELNKNPVDGFSAGLIDDNDIYKWEVVIIGPQDTL